MIGSTLEIKFVKRPPASLWQEETFCSSALPAAVAQVINSPTLKQPITRMMVVVSAVPFVAGCRCYAKSLLAFGMNVINGEIAEPMEYGAVCDRPRDEISVLVGSKIESAPSSDDSVFVPKLLAAATHTVKILSDTFASAD